MKLYVDLETQQFIQKPGFRNPVNMVVFKRGDSQRIEVQFLANGTTVTELDVSAAGIFGIKPTGKYDAATFLASDIGWTKEGTGVSTVYVFEPSLNTAEIDAILNANDADDTNDVAYVDAMLEIEWTISGTVYSTNTLIARIHNDVVKGYEGAATTAPGMDDWLTDRAVRYDLAQDLLSAGRQQAAANLGFPVYANLSAANAGEGVIGIPFYNIATDKYETTTDTI